jgi:hypothetical protein
MNKSDVPRALIPLDGDYSTVEGALAGFTALEQSFRQAEDRRAVFIGAYIVITSAMKQAIEAGQFKDSDWTRRYLVNFARLYIEALNAFERGDNERVPRAWRTAFELSRKNEGFVIQHLLLGVNAHINYDLAISLSRAGIDPDRPLRYDDHTGVNEVLKHAANNLQEHVERFYSPALYVLDKLWGHWDEEIATIMVDRARETAWHHCLALVECTCDDDRSAVLDRIDRHAGAFAELIARPYTTPLDLITAIRTCF